MRYASALARVVWGHVLLLGVIAGTVTWYFLDTYSASNSIESLAFIGSVSALALVTCGYLLFQIIRGGWRAEEGDKEEGEPVVAKQSTDARWYVTPLLMVLFGLFVLGADRVGFDVAAFLFIGLALMLQGERRVLFLILYPALFVVGLTYGFKAVVPVPMPTLLF